jgi:hypothetical protein
MKKNISKIRLFIHKKPIHFSTLSIIIINFVIFSFLFFNLVPNNNYISRHTSTTVFAFSNSYNTPISIPPNCTVDNTSALQNWLSGLPPGSIANFPTGGCYLIQGQLQIANTTNLTIKGNGTQLKRTDATVIATKNNLPIITLINNLGMSMNGLLIDGGYDGSNYGGVAYEGHYGIYLQCNNGITIDSISVNNIQGDFMLFQFDIGGKTCGGQLNRNISVTNSTFNVAGYHGLTFEAANGVTFNHDTFTKIAIDAVDLEYDIYSSTIINGQAFGSAEDNISLLNNTWDTWGIDFISSIQGQLPGVQQKNLIVSGNHLIGNSPIIQISGTDQSKTTADYYNDGLIFTNNILTGAARPTNGGSITSVFPGSAMKLQNVSNVNISNNTIPMFDGTPAYYPNHPYFGAVGAGKINGLILKNNNFSGALGVLNPNETYGNTNSDICGNTYQVNGSKTDSACSTPTCSSGQTGTPPNCSTPTCSSGQTGTPPNCVQAVDNGGAPIVGEITVLSSSAANQTQIYSPSSPLGKTLSNPVTANNVVVVLSKNAIKSKILKVVYSIDHKVFTTINSAPFTVDFTTGNLGNGCHILTTVIYNIDGTTSSSDQNLCIRHKSATYKLVAYKVGIGSVVLITSIVVCIMIVVKHKRMPWQKRYEDKLSSKTVGIVVG